MVNKNLRFNNTMTFNEQINVFGSYIVNLKIKYHEKFKEILPIKKVAKYYEATKEFKKMTTMWKSDQPKKVERR